MHWETRKKAGKKKKQQKSQEKKNKDKGKVILSRTQLTSVTASICSGLSRKEITLVKSQFYNPLKVKATLSYFKNMLLKLIFVLFSKFYVIQFPFFIKWHQKSFLLLLNTVFIKTFTMPNTVMFLVNFFLFILILISVVSIYN